ncbi:MAG: 16S rRNA (cytosine(967)-C(5))-methyltransferase RsmB, partial [Nitrospirae bacterium]
MRKETNPRVLACRVLLEVLSKGRPLKEALSRNIEKVPSKDRAFFHELLYGTIRHLLYIDWRLSFYLPKPERLRPETRANLRLGAYQALKMRVPGWAVVHETVEAEKATGKNTKLVNAVLRRIVEEPEEPPLPTDTIKRFSIKYSHPEWLVRRYIDMFGIEETAKLLKSNNSTPSLTLRVNTLKTTREAFVEKLHKMGIKARPTEFSPYGVALEEPVEHDVLLELLG